MLLRLQPYDLNVTYKPGKEISMGDALSRAHLPDAVPDIEPVMVNMINFIAVTPTRYKQFQECTADELNELHAVILKGWPDTKQETPHAIRMYWTVRDELSVSDGVVDKGMRIVVPPSIRPDILAQIHESHLGITKCKQRAREALFSAGMTQQIERLVSYYSKLIKVDKLENLSSAATINALNCQMSRHGIAEQLRSHNGTQFASREFAFYCKDDHIDNYTSSPAFPQSNGAAEWAVQFAKRLWHKCTDKHLALLDYRTTSLENCHLSPAQICMSRRPRNKLPIARELLRPTAYDVTKVRRSLDQEKERQRHYHDTHV